MEMNPNGHVHFDMYMRMHALYAIKSIERRVFPESPIANEIPSAPLTQIPLHPSESVRMALGRSLVRFRRRRRVRTREPRSEGRTHTSIVMQPRLSMQVKDRVRCTYLLYTRAIVHIAYQLCSYHYKTNSDSRLPIWYIWISSSIFIYFDLLQVMFS
jgi:hypothetical protein